METHVPRVTLEYRIPTKSTWKPWRLVVQVGVVVGVILVLLSMLLSTMCGSREGSNRIKCASNMKQIGLAAIMYANDHGGGFPDNLETLLETEDLIPAVMNCPTTGETPASGPTTQAVIEDFRKPGHISYVYVGKGLTVKSAADVVVLFEPLRNHTNNGMKVWSERLADHSGDGMNVLFADGQVEWLGNADGLSILAQFDSGVRPIRFPAAAPITQPSAR
jgi:prepilin-type processing-associated H-X9-DG protein